MAAVVQQQHLVVFPRGGELPAALGVADGDGQPGLAALPAPPAMLTRPWINVPSMVKNRALVDAIGVE